MSSYHLYLRKAISVIAIRKAQDGFKLTIYEAFIPIILVIFTTIAAISYPYLALWKVFVHSCLQNGHWSILRYVSKHRSNVSAGQDCHCWNHLMWPLSCLSARWPISTAWQFTPWNRIPDSKVNGANRQVPGGPRFGPMIFAIWDGYDQIPSNCSEFCTVAVLQFPSA